MISNQNECWNKLEMWKWMNWAWTFVHLRKKSTPWKCTKWKETLARCLMWFFCNNITSSFVSFFHVKSEGTKERSEARVGFKSLQPFMILNKGSLPGWLDSNFSAYNNNIQKRKKTDSFNQNLTQAWRCKKASSLHSYCSSKIFSVKR